MVMRVLALSITSILILSAVGLAGDGNLSSGERRKIETLLEHIAELNDVKFVRNGRAYNSQTAATFLRRKWEANDAQVNSARDFIDRIASTSSTSGEPYRIRFRDGAEVTSQDYLLAELTRIETEARTRSAARTPD
jgi:hypothetical protein